METTEKKLKINSQSSGQDQSKTRHSPALMFRCKGTYCGAWIQVLARKRKKKLNLAADPP